MHRGAHGTLDKVSGLNLSNLKRRSLTYPNRSHCENLQKFEKGNESLGITVVEANIAVARDQAGE